jgi:hypothetical protein
MLQSSQVTQTKHVAAIRQISCRNSPRLNLTVHIIPTKKYLSVIGKENLLFVAMEHAHLMSSKTLLNMRGKPN